MTNSLGPPDPWAEALKGWEPPELPKLEVPEPESLLYGVSPPSWLVEKITQLASSPSLIDKVAAVGTAARLGAGATTSPSFTLEFMMQCGPSPASRAANWARSLTPEVIEAVEFLVLNQAVILGDDIQSLHKMVALGGETARRAAWSVCVERDRLESAVYILERAVEVDAPTRSALDAIDEVATVHLSAIDLAGDLDDDLLSSVAWQEPHAWWGSLRK